MKWVLVGVVTFVFGAPFLCAFVAIHLIRSGEWKKGYQQTYGPDMINHTDED